MAIATFSIEMPTPNKQVTKSLDIHDASVK